MRHRANGDAHLLPTLLGFRRDDFLEGEAHAVPSPEVVRQVNQVRPVLLAHPLQGSVALREAVGGACWVWIYVVREELGRKQARPSAATPHIDRRDPVV